MVLVVLALAAFSVLGIFSPRYRYLAKETFDCIFCSITLRPHAPGFLGRIKSRLMEKITGLSPEAGELICRNFRIFSRLLMAAFFARVAYTAYETYNILSYGSCQPVYECIASQFLAGRIIQFLGIVNA